MTVRINIWSSPRNLSTALMYSFRQRADTTVVDEPLYAHYLQLTGRDHPGRDDVLKTQSTDGAAVVDEVVLGPYDTDVVMFKQMAKHLVGLDRSFLHRCRNVLLTREPADMLASFAKGVPDAGLDDTGLVELVEILDWLEADGQEPIVVEAGELLSDPAEVLGQLCDRLGLAYDPAMLTWPAGPKPEDGIWGRHWYDGVWASTGWQPRVERVPNLTPHLAAVLVEAQPLYERLARRRLTASNRPSGSDFGP